MQAEGTGTLRSRSTSRIRRPYEDSAELHRGSRRLDTQKETYEGEDTSPTTAREIWGWYCYGLAAEIFAVCGVGESGISFSETPRYGDFVLRPWHAIGVRTARLFNNSTAVSEPGRWLNPSQENAFSYSLVVLCHHFSTSHDRDHKIAGHSSIVHSR